MKMITLILGISIILDGSLTPFLTQAVSKFWAYLQAQRIFVFSVASQIYLHLYRTIET